MTDRYMGEYSGQRRLGGQTILSGSRRRKNVNNRGGSEVGTILLYISKGVS